VNAAHIGKELAAREIAKALSKLSIDELRKIAAQYGVDIEDELEDEYFTKTMLAEDDSLAGLAERTGHPAAINMARKLDELLARANDQDAGLAKIAGDRSKNGGALDKMEAFNARKAEDEALVKEHRSPGLTQAVMQRRMAAELDMFRRRDA
jgi:hypothetical protein